jgi:hypothetical protein
MRFYLHTVAKSSTRYIESCWNVHSGILHANTSFISMACIINRQGMVECLRCYDSRLRLTERKPDMYWHEGFQQALRRTSEDFEKELEESSQGVVDQALHGSTTDPPDPDGRSLQARRTLLYVSDTLGEVHNFGKCDSAEDKAVNSRIQNRIWQKNGHLLFIHVPYESVPVKTIQDLSWIPAAVDKYGPHVATSPGDFIPLLVKLYFLLKEGYVHGDIRCFNMLFGGCEGTFIDLDFSGIIGEQRFAQGYNFMELRDGRRPGSAGEFIAAWHDVTSFLRTFDYCHDLVPPATLGPSAASQMKTNLENIMNIFDAFRREAMIRLASGSAKMSMDNLDGRLAGGIKGLYKFLKEAERDGWGLTMNADYLEGILQSTKKATGSPNKKQGYV